MTDVFWLKSASIGKLHACLGRNDSVYGWNKWKRQRASFHVERDGRMLFITIRIGARFLNVDWV